MEARLGGDWTPLPGRRIPRIKFWWSAGAAAGGNGFPKKRSTLDGAQPSDRPEYRIQEGSAPWLYHRMQPVDLCLNAILSVISATGFARRPPSGPSCRRAGPCHATFLFCWQKTAPL